MIIISLDPKRKLRCNDDNDLYRSDSQVVRASVSGAVDLGLILSGVKPMTLKLLSWLTLIIKGTVWKTIRQVYLLCGWERRSAAFPHFSVVDRWLVTPKRARCRVLIAFLC